MHNGQQSEVIGRFWRNLMGFVVLRDMPTTAGRLGCVPWFWQALLLVGAKPPLRPSHKYALPHIEGNGHKLYKPARCSGSVAPIWPWIYH
jgi:hypothetical protein